MERPVPDLEKFNINFISNSKAPEGRNQDSVDSDPQDRAKPQKMGEAHIMWKESKNERINE